VIKYSNIQYECGNGKETLAGKHEEKDHLGDISVDDSIILKQILEE